MCGCVDALMRECVVSFAHLLIYPSTLLSVSIGVHPRFLFLRHGFTPIYTVVSSFASACICVHPRFPYPSWLLALNQPLRLGQKVLDFHILGKLLILTQLLQS